MEFTYTLSFQFTASNNEAEYEALIAGLRIAAHMRVCSVHVSVDSKLVANQVLGTYVAKEENMIKYLEKVKSLVSGFANFSISKVPKSKNKKADALGKIASTSFAYLSKQVLVEVLKEKSIQEKEVATVLHAGPRSVVAKAIRLGYYWPTMYRDARDMIRKCNDCQIHRPMPRNPQQPLTPVTALWPFYKWGIDIAGPFPNRPRKVKFLIVAIDYLTKWIEAKAVAIITGNQVKKTEAVILTEIKMPTHHTTAVDAVHNDEELRLNLDLLEERRECTAISEAKAKLKMTKYYNARVRGVTFRPGDFVYRSNDASHAMDGGKLGPK
nr:reverse transcriptase domain-containing protein [Tanacetum cinerariifolium]